jgi:hypothetical protein
MHAGIGAIRDGAEGISKDETAVGRTLYDLSYAAEYGHGSTREAIDAIRASRRHADRAVVAAAAGNALIAAKLEAQAAAAEADAVSMLERAKGYADDLLRGLETATERTDSAMSRARSMVKLDDSSRAAEIHVRIAAQSEALKAHAERAREIRARIPGSRDPAELQVACDHFGALRHDCEEGSGTAQQLASDSLGYGNEI